MPKMLKAFDLAPYAGKIVSFTDDGSYFSKNWTQSDDGKFVKKNVY